MPVPARRCFVRSPKSEIVAPNAFPLTNCGSLSSFLSFSSFLSVLDHPRWYNAMDTSRALELLLSAKNLAHTSTVFTFSKIAALAPGIGKVALCLLFLVNIRSWPLVWHCMSLYRPPSAKTEPWNSACLQIRVPVALAPQICHALRDVQIPCAEATGGRPMAGIHLTNRKEPLDNVSAV